VGHIVDLSGFWIPLVTPLQGEALDLPALKRLAGHLATTPVTGFVSCGSTGEAESLTHEEQLRVLDAVLAACRDKPVVMGLSGTRLGEMLPHLREVTRRPVAALLISAPYYLRPAQAGLIAHFRALADASPVPVVVYDIPARTGAVLTLDTLLTLAEHPNIRAIKDCGGDEEKTRALVADGRLAVLAGDDARIFSTCCVGGAGAIAAAGHLLPVHYARLAASAREGRVEEARRLHHALAPLSLALFAEPNPTVVKAMLARQGWMSDALRPPHSAASVEAVQRAWAALEATERVLAA
jgi:4-hydroxy-tetrahydrodipicolinate synthase